VQHYSALSECEPGENIKSVKPNFCKKYHYKPNKRTQTIHHRTITDYEYTDQLYSTAATRRRDPLASCRIFADKERIDGLF